MLVKTRKNKSKERELGVASKREKRRLRKNVECVETVALEACWFFEASERKRGGLHVESAIDSQERKGDSTDGETERMKRKSGFEAGRQERRRRSF